MHTAAASTAGDNPFGAEPGRMSTFAETVLQVRARGSDRQETVQHDVVVTSKALGGGSALAVVVDR